MVVTGGITQHGLASDLVQVYDMRDGTWSSIARMPIGRAHHAQVSLPDGRVLVVGGKTGWLPDRWELVLECVVIDPVAGTAELAGELPIGSMSPTAHLLPDGRAVAIAGDRASLYDPVQNKWLPQIALRRNRAGHASAVLADGRVVVAGGLGCHGIEVIDLVQGYSMELEARLPLALDDLRMVTLPGDRLWVLGGQDSRTGETTDQTWVIDLRAAGRPAILRGPALGVRDGVADHAAVRVGPWVVVAGGESERRGKDTELAEARLLDTRTLEVWSLPPLPVAQDDAAWVATDTGVAIIGGYRVGAGDPGGTGKVKGPAAVMRGIRRLTSVVQRPHAQAAVFHLALPGAGVPAEARSAAAAVDE